MGIVIKGGSTVINGKGKTDTGPSIPTDGLVMIIDPTTAQTATSTYRLYTPLTGSILTATSANITPGPNVGLNTYAYPTGAAGFVYANTGSAGTFTNPASALNTYYDIKGEALQYLQANVSNSITILYWYSGFSPGISYPDTPSDAFPNYKFSVKTNVSPSPVIPTAQASVALASSQMIFATDYYGASTARTWDPAGLSAPSFPTTGSMTISTSTVIPSSVFWGQANPMPLQTASVAPSYTTHPATPNLPSFHRSIPMTSFAGRGVYRDYDTWNCIAFTINQSTKAITSSVYINGGLFGEERAITSSLTTGVYAQGVSTAFPYGITNNNADTFYFTGSRIAGIGAGARIQIIPTSSGTFTDTSGYPANTRTYYCSSGSTIAATLQSVTNKINNTTELRAFFSASFTPTTIAISSSAVGTAFNNTTFYFSSSAQSVNTLLLTMANGIASSGTGPINTTLLQQVPNASALRVGVTEIPPIATGFYRRGLLGLLGGLYVYNRVLSQTEITQLYNTLKSRYGNTTPGNTSKSTYRLFNPVISGSSGTYEEPPSGSGIGY
jgi:hypothetical protein